MNKEKLFHSGRTASVVSSFFVLTFALMISIVVKSGLITGINSEVDEKEDSLIRSATMEITTEGNFVDCNGEPITLAEEPGREAEILFDESYSHLVGIRTPNGKVSGLRKGLFSYLFFGGDDRVGSTVRLTTNNALQEYCYQVLDKREGSVIVMDAETGALLALTSRSSAKQGYDAEMYNENYDLYSGYDAMFIDRATMAEDPPGSTFKIITASAMIENGMGDYVYDDMDGVYEVNGAGIHNAGNGIYGPGIDLEKALNKSINVYFASAAVEMAGHELSDMAQRFLLNQEIVLDFTRLESNFDLGFSNNKSLRAQAGFGQGNTVMSPLHVAMIMGAVMNDGKIMRPYVIEQIEDDGEVCYNKEEMVLSEAIQPETAAILKEYLHSTAEVSYGYTQERYGMVYAKTGTADQSNGKNHIYMLVGLETEERDYVILIDSRNVDRTSSDLVDPARSIIDYLLTM